MRTSREHVWPLVVVLAGAALFAVFRNGAAAYIPGDRFELFWNPSRTLARALTSWDDVRGLGQGYPGFVPVLALFTGSLRSLGLSPAVVERLYHATLLVVGGVGAVAVLRCWRRSIGVEHLVAGLLFMFNPFTASFLIPGLLFVNVALAPWFLVAFVRGVREPRRWRWPALFALLVFVPGFSNIPGSVWAMLPIVPAAWYFVFVERSVTLRGLLGWVARAGVLTILVSVAGLAKASIGSATYTVNLGSTESAQAVSVASSWAESWRGLGFWLSYWIDDRGVVKPETAVFFQSIPIILATFAAPIAACAVILWSRWRPRLLFGAIALTALVAMAGAYPFNTPTPFGRLLVSGYDTLPGFFGFRNTYKAGGGLVLGVAVLCGVGAATLLTRWSRRGLLAVTCLVIAMSVVFVMASLPFWSGDVYARASLTSIPRYYQDAFGWLDRQPGNTRVLVLPGSSGTLYRWGNPGDDILDAELSRPHVLRTGQPLSTPEGNSVVDALDEMLTNGSYVPGTLAPIARRLGIEYVLIRNDLDWQTLHLARPSTFDALRNDPTLVHARSYGSPGENVLQAGAKSPEAKGERNLAPVEILRVPEVPDVVRTTVTDQSVLVSGDGASWPMLSRLGMLDAAQPVRFTGDLTEAQLRDALAAGSSVVVTDTNRNRANTVDAFGPTSGPTLAKFEAPARGLRDLFETDGSQTIATWSDARVVSASKVNAGLPVGAASNPANAFDRDPTTAWLTGALTTAVGQRLRIDFARPTRLSEADLDVANPCCAGRVVTRATLLFSDGTSVPVQFRGHHAEVQFAPRQARWMEVRIDEARGGGNRPIGFTEVSLAGVDLRRFIQLPDDVFRAARRDAGLAALLAREPIVYSFERDDADADPALRRRFRTAGDRSYQLEGTLQLSASASDALVDSLIGRPTGAVSDARAGGALDTAGAYTVDGRLDTGWVAAALPGQTITTRFPERVVRSVGIITDAGSSWSRISQVELQIGDVRQVVDLSEPSGCASGAGAQCLTATRVDVPPTTADSMTVVVEKTEGRPGAVGTLPVRIDEITTGDQFNEPIDLTRPAPCLNAGVTIDDQAVPVTIDATLGELLAGDPVRYTACATVPLAAGWHRFDAGTSFVSGAATLAAGGDGATSAAADSHPASVRVLENDGTRIRARVTVPAGGTTLVANRSFAAGWTAEANGKDLGEPEAVDAQLAWRLTKPGTYDVDIRFAPQRTFDIALVVTLGGLLLCVVLIVRRRRPARPQPPREPPPTRASTSRAGTVLSIAAVVGVAFLASGFPGALLGISALAACRIGSPRLVALAGLAMLIVAAIATVIEASAQLGPGFASSRPVAAWAGVAAGVLLLVAIIEFASAEHSGRNAEAPREAS